MTTLELLFAQAAQRQTFLLLTAGGAVLGLLLHAAGKLHRYSRAAGMAADALCAMAAAALVMGAALRSGEGLRGYAFLGLLTGTLLYRTGVQPLAAGVVRRVKRLLPKQAARKAYAKRKATEKVFLQAGKAGAGEE